MDSEEAVWRLQLFVSGGRHYFTDPLSAFELAWRYERRDKMRDGNERESENRFFGCLNEEFVNVFSERCAPDNLLRGHASSSSEILARLERSRALSRYLDLLRGLLWAWREEPPQEPPPECAPGCKAALWCDAHPLILEEIQVGMRLRRRYPVLETVEGKRVLVLHDRFLGQRNWDQAAKTAAYTLFWEFLASEPEKLGFCGKCDKPFLRGKRTLFCSEKCAHRASAASSHNAKIRIGRVRQLRKMAKALDKWLGKSRRAGADWRRSVENSAGLEAASGRRSRVLGAYIRAAEAPIRPPSHGGVPERDELLRQLSDPRRPQDEKKLGQELDAFLGNVRRAQSKCVGASLAGSGGANRRKSRGRGGVE